MKIGIDIDDTLINSFEDFLDFYNEVHDSSLRKEDSTYEKKFHEFLGITKEELIRLYHKYDTHERSKNLKPTEGALEVLRTLVDKHEFILITARSEKLREKTFELVNKYYGEFNFDIIFNTTKGYNDKGEICVREGVDLMIDDDLDNALACVKSKIPVLLLETPWNGGKTEGDVKRVKNWKEIGNEIKKIEDNSTKVYSSKGEGQ